MENSLIKLIKETFTPKLISNIISVVVGLVIFILLYLLISMIYKKFAKEKLKAQTFKLIAKILKYSFFVLAVIYVLGIFNIKITALLGAAGIAGVAIGFAAQTSFSNIISGFFILSEKSIKIGDYITIKDVSGTVDSIDMLSVKIKTPDNQMVRVPNETIIKENLQNTSFYPTRLLNVNVSISYDDDMEKALEVLSKVPDKCSCLIKDSESFAYYDGFGNSGINLVLSVFLNNSDLITAKNQVYIEIKKAFDQANIQIPFAQLCVKVNQ